MRAWEARDPMTDLVVKLQEDIAAWQEASGLVNEHGDPDGIEPRHLAKHVASLERQLEEEKLRPCRTCETAGVEVRRLKRQLAEAQEAKGLPKGPQMNGDE